MGINKEKKMAKKEKKEQSRAAKIINIVIITIEIIIILASIAMSITIIIGSKTKTEELGSGFNITAVLTSSMEGNITDEYEIPSFKVGDLLIIQKLSDDEIKNIQVGDVVTYLGRVGGDLQLITHRVIKIEYSEEYDVTYYYTLGDKQKTGNETNDLALAQKYPSGNIQGKVTKVVPNIGKVIHWFQDSNNFLWAVVIPLAALLAYNIYVFIKLIVDYRIKKAKEEGQLAVEAVKAQNAIDEEEIKRKAIEEFLAQQKAQSAKEDKIENKVIDDSSNATDEVSK